jgi:ParB/Sulfiredoxin domain
MTIQEISIDSIICDQQIMPREKIDENYLNELVEDLKAGAVFPPVDLFYDDECYILTDGFHRWHAFKKAGYEKIQAAVHKGNKSEALLFSCGANANHGLRRTNEDKRKVVFNLLSDSKYCTYSDGLIAEKCAVTQPFVSKLRQELTHNGFESPSNRKGKDGRAIDTKNIGGRQSCEEDSSDGSDNGNGLKTLELSFKDLIPDQKPNPTTKESHKQGKGKNNVKKKDILFWPEEQTKELVNHITDISSKLIDIKKLVETKPTKSISRINKLKKKHEQIKKIFIDLNFELEDLTEV